MRSRSWLLGLALGVLPMSISTLTVPTTEARPIRRPGVHALLVDLAQIEAFNGERDDQQVGQQIHQQVVAVRINLLRVLSNQEHLHQAGRSAMEGLYNMAALNSRSFDRDPDVLYRVAGSIEHMRQRLEQLMQKFGPFQAVPVPRDYRPPVGYQPPIYRGPVWDPFDPKSIPSAPPVYQQPSQPSPPVYQQPVTPPPVYQQPVTPPPVYQQPVTPPPVYQQPSYPPPGYQPPPPVYQQPQVMPVPPSQFGSLLSGLQRLSFSDEKQNYVRDLAKSGYYFTCEQIVQLMKTSSFGDDQVKIGSALYPRAVDPQNFMQMTSSLTFESDRQKLRRLIGK
jgi:hypothetical protein